MSDPAAPSPTTILFTDVEGSTDMSTRVGDERTQELMRAHEALVRVQVAEHGGREIKSLGDGFMLSFASPRAALDCAKAIQQDLATSREGGVEGTVEVRMGLNTGEVMERDGDIFGTAVNIAARVAAKARGGQILISPVVRDMLEEAEVLDRGLFWLKGVPERVRLFEVDWRGGSAPVSGTSFVGRESELADLRRFVEHAAAGHGALVMLGGEPGVGKSRLAQEVAREAADLGMLTLIGHCDELEVGTPYLPVVEIIESAARQVDAGAFTAALGEDASEIARLTPEVRKFVPDLPPPLELPPEQARRYLFNSVWGFLDRAARAQPTLLILDDLHWADEATLLLVQHLADRITDVPVLIVGTYRDVELDVARPLARTLEELVRRRLAHRISVHRLAVDEVRDLLGTMARQPPPQTLVDAVYAETEGNPFFVEEVYQHLLEGGRLFDERGGFRADLQIDELDVPESVRLVIGRRLDRLTDTARTALAAASVIGRRFAFDLLEAVGEVEGDDLVDAVDEAERTRLIVADAEAAVPSYGFAHELIRQTLLSGLSVVKRQRLHAKVADAVERIYAGTLDDYAADLAHHLLRAGSSGRPGDAARYLLTAGRRAFEASAFEESLKHLENAAAMQDALAPRDQADLWFQLGMAHRSVGRWEEALKDWDRALDQLESLGEREQVAVVCWHAGFQLAWAGRFDEALVLTGRGLAAVEGMDTPEHARLLGMGGLMFGAGGYYDAARQMLDQAVEMADRLGDPGAQGTVLSLRCLFHWSYLESEESLQAGLEAERLLREAGDLFEVSQALSFVMFSLMFLGRFDEATEVRERALPLAERFGHHAAYITLLRGEAAVVWLTGGDHETYAPLAQRDFDLNRAADLPWIAESYVFLGSNASYRGRKDEASELLRQAVAHETAGFSVGWHRAALVHHLALYGERDEVMAVLDDPETPLPVPGEPATTGAWAMLVETIESFAQMGERERAAALYPSIQWAIEAGLMMEPIRGRLVQTTAGIAAAAAGDWENAERHFDTASEMAERLSLRNERVELLRFRAWMHLWRDEEGDRQAAGRLLEDAMREYEAMGMPRHVEVSRALMAKVTA